MSRIRFPLAAATMSAFAISAMAGCDKGPVFEKLIVISGTVRSATTHAPIASAWVAISDSITGLRTETDSTGLFTQASTPFRQTQLFTGATGYFTLDTTPKDGLEDIEGLLVELVPSQ